MFFSFYSRHRGREGEREGENHQWKRETLINCLLHAPWPGIEPTPRHVPWLGMEPVTFQFAGWCPTNWATLATLAEPHCVLDIPFTCTTLPLDQGSWGPELSCWLLCRMKFTVHPQGPEAWIYCVWGVLNKSRLSFFTFWLPSHKP